MTAPLAPGSVLAGRYRIEAQIGEGGYGRVFRALDQAIGRPVALKVMRAERHGGDGALRFESEAMAARGLQHPNTVRLLDFGRSDQGTLYIAYELLDGEPLDRTLARGPMDPWRVAGIGVQVLGSLAEAHRAGLVHRDIKPANIFMCRYAGAGDFVKVLDLGLAKSVEIGRGLTPTGFAVGTPSYMAPEQVRGEPPTPAVDVYALGLVLAEAIAGAVIVQGATDAVIAAAQLSTEPVPLPPSVLQSPLGPVIHRATQKLASRRYPAVEPMMAALQELLGQTGSRAQAPHAQAAAALPTAVPTAQPRPRSRGRAIPIALAALVVLGGAATAVALALDAGVLAARDDDDDGDSGLAAEEALAKLERKDVMKRLEEAGYAVVERKVPGMRYRTFVMGMTSSVLFADDAKGRKQLEKVCKQMNLPVRASGDRAVAVSGFGEKKAERFLEELIADELPAVRKREAEPVGELGTLTLDGVKTRLGALGYSTESTSKMGTFDSIVVRSKSAGGPGDALFIQLATEQNGARTLAYSFQTSGADARGRIAKAPARALAVFGAHDGLKDEASTLFAALLGIEGR